MRYLSLILVLLLIKSENLSCQNMQKINDTLYFDDPLESKNYIFLGRINYSPDTIFNEESVIYNYKKPSIKLSTNEIEIRCVRNFHEEEYSMITSIYNNNIWKYNYEFVDHSKQKENTIKKCKDTNCVRMFNLYYNNLESKKIKYENTHKTFNLDSLFHVLTLNNVFDQSNVFENKDFHIYSAYNKLTHKIEDFDRFPISDGKACNIYFKVFNTIGKYYFSNVDAYSQHYPNNKQFKEQVEILKVFDFISNQ